MVHETLFDRKLSVLIFWFSLIQFSPHKINFQLFQELKKFEIVIFNLGAERQKEMNTYDELIAITRKKSNFTFFDYIG